MIGMAELIASFTHLLMLLENAIHCPPRVEVLLLIEQGRIDSTRCLIDEPGTVECLSEHGLLHLAQCARGRGWWRSRDYLQPWLLAAPVEAAPRNCQCLAGHGDANLRGQIRESSFDPVDLPVARSCQPEQLGGFFWTSMMVSARFISASRRSIRRRRAAFSTASGSTYGPRFLGGRA
jgi:hypothetical protein